MLEFSILQFPMRFGVDEGTDPLHVPPGTLTTLENGVWRKGGIIEKRYGTVALAQAIDGGGTISSAERLFVRGSELLLSSGNNLYSYSSDSGTWHLKGELPPASMSWDVLVDTTAKGIMSWDIAVVAGRMVVGWVTGDPTDSAAIGDALYRVIDIDTGAMVKEGTLGISNYNTVKVREVNGTVAIAYADPAGSNISAITVNPTTLAVGTPTSLTTDWFGTGWDLVTIGTNVVLGYESNLGAPILRLKAFSSSLVAGATGSISGEAGTVYNSLSLAGAAGEVLYVAYHVLSSTTVRIATANASTLAQITAPVTIESVDASHVSVMRLDATNCVVAYTATPATTPGRTTTYKVSSTCVVSSSSIRQSWGTQIISRPFLIGSRVFMTVTDAVIAGYSDFRGAEGMLVEVDTDIGPAITPVHTYVGRYEVGVSGVSILGSVHTPVALSSTETVVATPYLSSVTSSIRGWRQGLKLLRVSTGASVAEDNHSHVAYGQDLYVSGATLQAYDGRVLFDYGFPRGPVWKSTTVSTPAGAIAIGKYLYSFHFEYRAATGTLHRSEVGSSLVPINVSSTPSQAAIIVIGASVGSKPSLGQTSLRVQIPVYRSIAGGVVPQRLSVDPSANVLANDPTAQTQTFTDTRVDTDIDGFGLDLAVRPPLYTTGGVLEDAQPPASVTQFRHAERLWVLAGDRRTWWYSKSFRDDLGVAPGFHANFRIEFAIDQVAGASMDEKAIFFSSDGIHYLPGQGPAKDGSASDYGAPIPISSDVGCTLARSVVQTPAGIMFLSRRGIYLLSRGLELAWIGRPVRDVLATYPVVTSAVLVASENHVRFTCSNAARTVGATLVFDYVEQQWSTFRHTDTVYGDPFVDAVLHDGVWTALSLSGAVYKESRTTHRDGSVAWVPLTIETAWISAGGPVAFQSVRTVTALGESYTDHDLTVEAAFDLDDYAQYRLFNYPSDVTEVGKHERFTMTIGTRRKCSSIRFRVKDAAPSSSSATVGTGRGPAFRALGMELGIKKGIATAKATRKG